MAVINLHVLPSPRIIATEFALTGFVWCFVQHYLVLKWLAVISAAQAGKVHVSFT